MPRRHRLETFLLLALLALGWGCGDDNCAPGSAATVTPVPTATPIPLSSAEVLAPGPYGVGVTTFAFEDTSRPTMPNGAFAGSPTRELPTEVWYPAAPVANPPPDGLRDAALVATGAPYPLVIHSHGFTDRRIGGGFLARHLASHGYIVASPDFPLSNFNAPGRPTSADVPNQPGDVSFVIDQMLALNADPQSQFAGAIDPERIGLSGLSLGGLTTSLTTFHPTLRDPRVRAAVSIAGPACFLGPHFYQSASVPLLIVHGDIDAIVPYVENGRFQFATANPPKYLVTVANATHTAFNEIGARLIASNPDDVGCIALGGPRPPGVGPGFLDDLGGAEAGIIEGDCPGACTDPTPRPIALRGARQLELAILSIVPFFESVLRDDAAARQFFATRLAEENPEINLESAPTVRGVVRVAFGHGGTEPSRAGRLAGGAPVFPHRSGALAFIESGGAARGRHGVRGPAPRRQQRGRAAVHPHRRHRQERLRLHGRASRAVPPAAARPATRRDGLRNLPHSGLCLPQHVGSERVHEHARGLEPPARRRAEARPRLT